MPRRARVVRRPALPDAKFNNVTVQRFINKVMQSGKKSTAERIVYGGLTVVEEQTHRSPVDTLEMALRNATPLLEVKPRQIYRKLTFVAMGGQEQEEGILSGVHHAAA